MPSHFFKNCPYKWDLLRNNILIAFRGKYKWLPCGPFWNTTAHIWTLIQSNVEPEQCLDRRQLVWLQICLEVSLMSSKAATSEGMSSWCPAQIEHLQPIPVGSLKVLMVFIIRTDTSLNLINQNISFAVLYSTLNYKVSGSFKWN